MSDYDCRVFENRVYDELSCAICKTPMDDPVLTKCDHLFCRQCIGEWLSRNNNCPIDRRKLVLDDTHPAPRVVRNLLDQLRMRCYFSGDGCPLILPINDYTRHVDECAYNPGAELRCQMCGQLMTRKALRQHKCWLNVTRDMAEQKQSIDLLRQTNGFLLFILLMIFLYYWCPLLLNKLNIINHSKIDV
ncbi:E3 ubiquitin-protein ligase NRDP1-like [Oppia nitens]|uniref:E3 ubiquitin-protein ligase NRDP1-like n=1 Tax=Oppia nitens TaxID=1686743 RepID=UPI0023DAAD7D|nr:E3 ubiquitin-protein ligase NRDP1-like [Oppia nitens]